MLKTDRKGPLCLVAASVFWSLGGMCIKFIPWSGVSIIGMRAALAAVVFAVFRKSVRVKLTSGNFLAAVCLCGTTSLFVFANQLTTAAAAILLQFTSPAFIIIYQFAFYRKKPALSEVAAVLFTLSGMVLFFGDNLSTGNTLGNILAIGSGMAFAGVFIFNKRPDVDPEQSIMLGFYINAVLWTPFALFDPGISPDPIALGAIVLLGVVQVGLAYVFFSIGIKRTPALLACLITALEAILNPVWVALTAREMPGRFALAGGAVIIITIITYNIWVDRHKNREPGAG